MSLLKAGGYSNLSSCFTVHLAASVSITARVQVPGIANCKVHVQKCAAANLATENRFIQKTKKEKHIHCTEKTVNVTSDPI